MTAARLLTAADMAHNTRVNRAAALADHGVDLDTHTVTFAGEVRPRTDAERAERRAPIIARGQVAVAFGPRFDLESYALFLRAKTLPEWDLSYDWQTDTYVLSAPARYAAVLTGEAHEAPATPTDLAPHLFDYQRWIVARALAAQRFACWSDTGTGKTAMFLEWARQVREMTGGRVLILSPLGIIEQTRAEAARFYGDTLPIERLDSREQLAAWCTGEGPAIGISNYEKLIPGVLPELRHLAGLVADECLAAGTPVDTPDGPRAIETIRPGDTVFSGLDDSFERMYQAIRRCYRFGQTEPVHVYIPIIPELEGMIFDNVRTKEAMFLRDVAEQERHYRAALAGELQ